MKKTVIRLVSAVLLSITFIPGAIAQLTTLPSGGNKKAMVGEPCGANRCYHSL